MLKKIAEKIERKIDHILEPEWPLPIYEGNDEPTFLLMLTPPYSGSTAIADFLAQDLSIDGLFLPYYEGQWMIKGMGRDDRWQADTVFNYESIRRVWLNRYFEMKKEQANLSYIIEKSPPNMMRYKKIMAEFKDVRVVCNIRDPFANISSIAYRHHKFDKAGSAKRIRVVKALAQDWLTRAYALKEIVAREGYPLLTYEEFCADPPLIFEKFDLQTTIPRNEQGSYKVKVKDYPDQEIKNMNDRQIGRLSEDEKRAISEVLMAHCNLLQFFGYSAFAE